MQFNLTPMTAEYARQIVEWKYDGQYAFYDYDKEADHILDSSKWGRTLFAVLDEAGQICGELTLGFLDTADEWVSQMDMDTRLLDGCILWIGFGMRPNLTGHGLGLAFVKACSDFAVAFARQQYHYRGEFIGLGVYQFNQRAIKVYERAGFVKFREGVRGKNGVEYRSQRMKKQIEQPEAA